MVEVAACITIDLHFRTDRYYACSMDTCVVWGLLSHPLIYASFTSRIHMRRGRKTSPSLTLTRAFASRHALRTPNTCIICIYNKTSTDGCSISRRGRSTVDE